ncbi:MAG: hypothetical protein U5J96_00345 [Ignavibacteriaceae bacterium]|nr:hypothetical protein [Ignavibacteriaceae bacterium]
MKTLIFGSILISLLITNVDRSFAQSEDKKNNFPLTIAYIDIFNLDSIYTRSQWVTRSIPPSRSYHFEEYVYTLVLNIVVLGEDIWNKPFALIYELPDKEKGFIVVNEEEYELAPERFNNLLVEIHTKKKGWAKFELALFDEVSGGVYIPINSYPLRRRDFLLE